MILQSQCVLFSSTVLSLFSNNLEITVPWEKLNARQMVSLSMLRLFPPVFSIPRLLNFSEEGRNGCSTLRKSKVGFGWLKPIPRQGRTLGI